MGFDLLLWGILLLVSPFYGITDIVAAILIIVALSRGEAYLKDFDRASSFSCLFLITGISELIFGYIIPNMSLATRVLAIWRCGLLIPILVHIILGIKELAIIGENKEIHDMAERLRRPMAITVATFAVTIALEGFFSWLYPVAVTLSVAFSVLVMMLFSVVFRCYKELNIYPGAVSDDDEDL